MKREPKCKVKCAKCGKQARPWKLGHMMVEGALFGRKVCRACLLAAAAEILAIAVRSR